jgi:NADH:ubiquinone oxidoreductase subunit
MRTKGGRIDPTLGFERRWVIYKGLAEPSTIGPAWHGWMHHTVDTPPTLEKVTPMPWWKPHRPNLTGHPYGAKGVAEVNICPPMAAIANAIERAIGMRLTELPMSPPKVLAAIDARGQK